MSEKENPLNNQEDGQEILLSSDGEENSTEDVEGLTEEVAEIAEAEASKFKKGLFSFSILLIAAAGIIFYTQNNSVQTFTETEQDSVQSLNDSTQEELPVEEVNLEKPAIQKALELGEEIGCDTLHFDNEYGRLPCGDKETYLEQIRLYETKQLTSRLYIVTIIFLIILIFLSYFIYRQSKIHKSIEINGEKYLMPIEWVEVINQLVEGSSSNEDVLKKVYLLNQDLPQNFINLQNTFLALQKKLDSQDSEIDRLKKGYDNHIIKKMVSRFIKVFSYVEELKDNNVGDENLKNISLFLEDALADCSVTEFSPQLGSDFRETDGLDPNPEIIETNKKDMNFKIANIKKTGFKISYQDAFEVLQPAHVSVYKYINSDEEDNKQEEER